MANQLRGAGQDIFGENSADIHRLAQLPADAATGDGLRAVDLQSLQLRPAAGPMGRRQRRRRRAAERGALRPVPAGLSPGVAGKGMPSAAIPVPGAGEMPQGGAEMGAGDLPVPGAEVIASPASVGGTYAGRGTAPLGDTATKAWPRGHAGGPRAAGQGPLASAQR